VGTVAELPSLSWIAQDQFEALQGISELAQSIVSELISTGQEVPCALSEKEFSGKFMVRIPPEAHRLLAIDAAEQNLSLNRLVSSRLVRS